MIPINKTHAVVFEQPKTHKIVHNLTQISSAVPKIVAINKTIHKKDIVKN
jgi:hypothetical protein